MNKNAIQKYAIWARNELIEQVKQRAYQYGITDTGYGEENAVTVAGRALSSDEARQRQEFVNLIKRNGFKQAVEEVAYTWFNRFVALRYMEVNDFLPTHVRVFSDTSGNFNPEILKDVLHLDLERLDKAKVSMLLNANKTEELYRYLLLTQCNALNALLPEMFERMGMYTEMLLPNNILSSDGVIGRLVSDIIPEDTWRDGVQIIGWLYQYYNTELKQAVFDGLKKNIKITKANIPAATQIFTPDWIVRYMVENSLGRLWLERHPNDALKANWKYYIDEAEQDPSVAEQLQAIRAANPINSPEDIMFIDPCMGSGHILVYAFDVLMQIYQSVGYAERDAARLILEKNLYGLDIDKRAYQLAYFAVMMKARQYDSKLFTRKVSLNLCDIKESNEIEGSYQHEMGNFLLEKANQDTLNYILDAFLDAKEYGSILRLERRDYAALEYAWRYTASQTASNFNLTLWYAAVKDFIPGFIRQARYLTQKYDVVCTNPPYMGSSGMNGKLAEFVKREYPDSKSDLFAAFIEQCFAMTRPQRYFAMITQHAWMFLSSFEKLREKLNRTNTVNMAHLGPRAFAEIGGEVVQSTAFVMQSNHVAGYKSTYVRLVDSPNAESKERDYLSGNYRYTASADNFKKIPGSPVAYWASEAMLEVYNNKTLIDISKPCKGIDTGNNDLFLRKWFEVSIKKQFIPDGKLTTMNDCKIKRWFPYNKGGAYRKWYGNNEYLLDWNNDGSFLRSFSGSNLRNKNFYFQKGITWSTVTSGNLSLRFFTYGFLFDNGGCCLFAEGNLLYILGLSNSNTAKLLLEISPTLNYQPGDIGKIPAIISNEAKDDINILVEKNISISKADWDSFETSWDFVRHPLLGDGGVTSIEESYREWKACVESRFVQLKTNEEELNRIFIDIYGLQDELTPEVADRDVTVARIYDSKEDIPESMKGNGYVLTKADVVKSLVSYGVGCMFGRYSPEIDGLAYAGGEWDAGKYGGFAPDKDNILPICDDEYFDDDIVGRFTAFVRAAFGEDKLEANLDFIAGALSDRGGIAREIIRNYFIGDFYKDHVRTHKKRPIYWLFDSGKKNGFKALVYMHRYSRDLLAKLRTDYVHEQQERYRTQLSHIVIALDSAAGAERARLLKQQDKLTEQARELRAYEEKIHHLSDRNIMIDLDDGVKHNYAIFADVLAKI